MTDSESDKGLLKDFYPEASPIGDALKKKREKLAETKGVEVKED